MDKMTITSAKYLSEESVNTGINATIDGITMSVPLDVANRHYAAILKAVEDGDLVIQEADKNGS